MSLTLVEKLENYRADRPDEYTMDEFIRGAKKLERERGEFEAHCARLQNAFVKWNETDGGGINGARADQALVEAFEQTPSQSLAEIQAKAINDAVEHCKTKLQYNDGTYKIQIHVNDLEDYASDLRIKAST